MDFIWILHKNGTRALISSIHWPAETEINCSVAPWARTTKNVKKAVSHVKKFDLRFL